MGNVKYPSLFSRGVIKSLSLFLSPSPPFLPDECLAIIAAVLTKLFSTNLKFTKFFEKRSV